MSYTVPNRPIRVQQQRDRTRSQNPQAQQHGDDDGAFNSPVRDTGARHKTNPQNEEPQRREPEVRNAFTMIPPNEKKRQQITRKAEAETQAYEAYKKKNQLGHVSYVGTAGDGVYGASEQAARQKAAHEHKTMQFNARQKSQQWRENKKRTEEKEIQVKKDVQRAKSQQNAINEKERQQMLQDDHRRKNQAFLDRLERQGGR